MVFVAPEQAAAAVTGLMGNVVIVVVPTTTESHPELDTLGSSLTQTPWGIVSSATLNPLTPLPVIVTAPFSWCLMVDPETGQDEGIALAVIKVEFNDAVL